MEWERFAPPPLRPVLGRAVPCAPRRGYREVPTFRMRPRAAYWWRFAETWEKGVA